MQTNGAPHTPAPEPTAAYITESGHTLLIAYLVDGDEPRSILATVDARTGHISHLTDWALIEDLRAADLVTAHHGGPSTYGHVDYALPRAAIAAATEHAQTISTAEYFQIKEGAR